MENRTFRVAIKAMTALVLTFLYAPLAIVVLYAFTKTRDASWPPRLFTTSWFGVAWRNPELKPALANSLKAGVAATVIALVLGSLAAFAVHRFHFFGRNTLSFALVLPIALPGIVTALSLSSFVDVTPQLTFGLFAIIIGHATFCIVVVYNNVVARLRRTSGSLVEASMDLGADGVQTFRYITFPALRSAIIAAALLAFGLSFDEIIVTLYLAGTNSTLPLWIYDNIRLPINRPIVNVVAMVVLLVSIVPVYIATRLAGGDAGITRAKVRAREPGS
jgi:putative spermidine/putrescine transport system permease protein